MGTEKKEPIPPTAFKQVLRKVDPAPKSQPSQAPKKPLVAKPNASVRDLISIWEKGQFKD